MRVFVSAGEASGDAYGAAFISELSRLTAVQAEGLGGRRMREAGVSLIADTGTWGAISITQSLKVVPRVLGAFFRAKRLLATGSPGLFVPIDFGYANIRLARYAKSKGWKVLYFVPPGSWRRDRQGGDLPAITDAISTPFPWSAEILREMGANAHWFGHPIKQLLRRGQGESPSEGTDAIGVLPGSRHHEIAENLPLIAEAMRSEERPLEFALAPTVDVVQFRERWRALAPGREQDRFTSADTYGVLRRARAAIVCSGTATLEAALLHCPMVVIYRVSKAVEFEAKLIGFKRPRFVALPNILLEREAVPELIQEAATPGAVRAALATLLVEGEARRAQIAAFDELDELLGPDDAIRQTAELALRIM